MKGTLRGLGLAWLVTALILNAVGSAAAVGMSSFGYPSTHITMPIGDWVFDLVWNLTTIGGG